MNLFDTENVSQFVRVKFSMNIINTLYKKMTISQKNSTKNGMTFYCYEIRKVS